MGDRRLRGLRNLDYLRACTEYELYQNCDHRNKWLVVALQCYSHNQAHQAIRRRDCGLGNRYDGGNDWELDT